MKAFKKWRTQLLTPLQRDVEVEDPYRAKPVIASSFLSGVSVPLKKPRLLKAIRLRQTLAREIRLKTLDKEADANPFPGLKGGSKIANFLQHADPIVGRINDLFDHTFKFVTGANAYLTPPRSQTLVRHWDAHDVFLFQIRGKKRWLISKPIVRNPVEKGFGPATEIVLDVILEPGSILCIPKGYQHEGVALDARSVHVTFGLYQIDFKNVLPKTRAARKLAELRLDQSHPLFRKERAPRKKKARFKRSRSRFVVLRGDQHYRILTSHRELQLTIDEFAEFRKLIKKKVLSEHPLLDELWRSYLIDLA